jgi:hypothetical protein
MLMFDYVHICFDQFFQARHQTNLTLLRTYLELSAAQPFTQPML